MSGGWGRERMEYLKLYRDRWEILRRLAIGDTSLLEQPLYAEGDDGVTSLDPRTVAFSRLGALLAIGTTASGYQAQVDAAFAAGATTEEIIHTLIALAPIVGFARVISAAPALGLAMGYDIEAALELLETE